MVNPKNRNIDQNYMGNDTYTNYENKNIEIKNGNQSCDRKGCTKPANKKYDTIGYRFCSDKHRAECLGHLCIKSR